jgi:hypothetical protein
MSVMSYNGAAIIGAFKCFLMRSDFIFSPNFSSTMMMRVPFDDDSRRVYYVPTLLFDFYI